MLSRPTQILTPPHKYMPEVSEPEFKEAYDDLMEGYEHAKAELQEYIGRAYDRAIASGRDPAQLVARELDDPELHAVHGKYVTDALDQLPQIPSDRQTFIEQSTAIFATLLWRQIFLPSVRERAASNFGEFLSTGNKDQPHLDLSIHPLQAKMTDHSDFQYTFPDNIEIHNGEPVLEIAWPAHGPGPRGSQDTLSAFQTIASMLRDRPEVKAVMLISWMAGRSGLMNRLGFHVIPEAIDPRERELSFIAALAGRKDKPYDRMIKPEDVHMAMMTRDEFLQKYLQAE